MTTTININITPTALKLGVMTLPIDVCRNWYADGSVFGKFIYAGRVCDTTFTPKHREREAPAWQFTINDSVQFAMLKIDGVYTYAEEKFAQEQLVCEFDETDNKVTIRVICVRKRPETNATKKLCQLLRQGIRPESEKESTAPEWNAPSAWTDFSKVEEYKDVTDCLYMWYGKVDGEATTYLYVGIVGDTNTPGKSKRHLCKRLNEEQASAYEKYGKDIKIQKFRYCSLNNAHGYSVPELLKTIEMSEITIMTSLFNCDNARANIDALFSQSDVVVLNSRTSYKYVE